MAANALAQNLFAQVDAEGNCHVLFDEIIDHRTDGKEIKQQNAFLTTRSGTRRRRETTIGWEILVQWKDQSTSWIALKDMKDSFPVQLAKNSVRARISQEPAFAWWVSFVLKKRNRIIAKVKSSRNIGFEPTSSAFAYLSQLPRQRDSTKPTVIRCGGTRFAKK